MPINRLCPRWKTAPRPGHSTKPNWLKLTRDVMNITEHGIEMQTAYSWAAANNTSALGVDPNRVPM